MSVSQIRKLCIHQDTNSIDSGPEEYLLYFFGSLFGMKRCMNGHDVVFK